MADVNAFVKSWLEEGNTQKTKGFPILLMNAAAHKPVPSLYIRIFSLLSERSINNLISFADCREILAACFRIKRADHFEILKEMEAFGLIEYRPYHDVKLREMA